MVELSYQQLFWFLSLAAALAGCAAYFLGVMMGMGFERSALRVAARCGAVRECDGELYRITPAPEKTNNP